MYICGTKFRLNSFVELYRKNSLVTAKIKYTFTKNNIYIYGLEIFKEHIKTIKILLLTNLLVS